MKIGLNKRSKIYIAGHTGLVGSSLLKTLSDHGYENLIYRSHHDLNLIEQSQVEAFLKKEKPEYVFLVAGKVGGILANDQYPADFIYQNIMIQTNVMHSSYLVGVKKLLFLGSSCIYPRDCPQPIKEEYLLNGFLEKTNEPYAIAKIAGIKMCQSYNRQYGTKFISAMPTNLYGPNDHFDLDSSHVIPALIRKFHDAKISMENGIKKDVILWGSGSPRREFLFNEDLARACLFLMDRYDSNETINVGVGKDMTIRELSQVIKNVIGFKGDVVFDSSKPDGTPQKLLDIAKIKSMGWYPSVDFDEGIRNTYQWYIQSQLK